MYDETMAERVRLELAPLTPFTERKMFGGLCFLIGGNMACGIVREELMVRTGPNEYEAALKRPGARPMDFTGRPMRGMVMVDPGSLAGETLGEWIRLGATFAGGLSARGAK
jgi:TfoX/Sxy family transcriptional regulator of competence genes